MVALRKDQVNLVRDWFGIMSWQQMIWLREMISKTGKSIKDLKWEECEIFLFSGVNNICGIFRFFKALKI